MLSRFIECTKFISNTFILWVSNKNQYADLDCIASSNANANLIIASLHFCFIK